MCLLLNWQNCKLSIYMYFFQLCTCSRMCLLLNWQNCKLSIYMYFFSFVHTLVCANCKYFVLLVILLKKKKKKKKKKRKMTHTSVMGKKYQSYATYAPLSIFSLGKGRESLCLKPYENLFTSALSDLLPQHIMFRQGVNNTHQNCPKYVSG